MTDNTRKKIVRWFWILLLTPIVLIFVLLGFVWAFAEIPTIEELENPDSKLATQVIAEEGEILTTYHIENRTFVSYDELPEHLVQATVATEDARFYSHSGIDIPSLFRVLFKTLLSRDSSQGGGSQPFRHRHPQPVPRSVQDAPVPRFQSGWRLHHHPAAGEDPLPPQGARLQAGHDLDQAP